MKPEGIRSLRPAAAAVMVAALVAATLFASAQRPFPFVGGDEQGHFSYLAHLVSTGDWWPDLGTMRMRDLSGAATPELNFINHPPTFYLMSEPVYALLGALGLGPSWLRAFAILLAGAAFALVAALLVRMRFGVLPIATAFVALLLLRVPAYSAFYNNDQLALLGGALACWGATRRVADPEDRTGLAILLAGVALASVKLTALMLVGSFAALALFGAHMRRPDVSGLAALAGVGLAASAPFLVYMVAYGSPAPDMPGQIAMLKSYVDVNGLSAAPRVGFAEFIAQAPFRFALQLGGGPVVLAGFVALCLAPFAAFFGEARDREEAVVRAVVRAAMIATCAVLAVHLVFAFRRYVAYGWLGDLYPRYYFPLLGAYALGWALAARRLGRAAFELWKRSLSDIRPHSAEKRQG